MAPNGGRPSVGDQPMVLEDGNHVEIHALDEEDLSDDDDHDLVDGDRDDG